MIEITMIPVVIATIVLTFIGAFAYRWRGMNENDVPSFLRNRTVRRILCVLLPAIGFVIATQNLWFLFAGPLMFYGIIVGHGSYFPRGKNGEPNEDNEQFKFLTKLISDPLNEKARFFGMALTGLATTVPVLLIPVGLMFAGIPVDFGLWYGLVGILKAAVYWLTPDTEYAEYAWGAVYTGLAVLV